MRTHVLPLTLLILAAGCGPLAFPMVQRLTPQEQLELELMWQNMLTPAQRLDRQTLLDCVILYQLHHRGVDELRLRSIKHTSEGRVEMTLDFDRASPAKDRFNVRVVGSFGRTLRNESWTGAQVMAALDELSGRSTATVDPTTGAQVALTDSQREQRAYERLDRLAAATQPAGP